MTNQDTDSTLFPKGWLAEELDTVTTKIRNGSTNDRPALTGLRADEVKDSDLFRYVHE